MVTASGLERPTCIRTEILFIIIMHEIMGKWWRERKVYKVICRKIAGYRFCKYMYMFIEFCCVKWPLKKTSHLWIFIKQRRYDLTALKVKPLRWTLERGIIHILRCWDYTRLGFKRYNKLHKESEWRLFTVTSHVKDTNFVKTNQIKNV